MDLKTQLEHALARRDYQSVVELLANESADSLGPLVRSLRFARNMLALRRRDPAIADEVENAPSTARVRITVAPDHRHTLTLAGAAPDALCPGGSPSAVIEQTEARLREIPDPSRSIALAGVGDGYAVTRLADERPDLLGRERVVYIIEPDAEIFRSAMLLHDWHDKHGPFASGRFLLFVGDNWQERLHKSLTADSRLPPPEKAIKLCVDPSAIREGLRAAVGNIGEQIRARKRRISEACAPLSPSCIAEKLGTPEQVRVMLLTTRYSTVLQYSTRDLAEGFERLGCKARVVIEKQPWEQHLIASLLGEVERFRPDLVIQIDHHRHETPGVFPVQIPFVCIVQDNLSNLTSRQAGEKMGPTDFAAGSWIRRYAIEYGYPPGRCIEIPRLTRAPKAPAIHTGGGEDILYVSNHSATPERAIEIAAGAFDESQQPDLARFVRACGSDLIAHYADGGVLEDSVEVDAFVADASRRHGLTGLSPDMLSALGDRIGVTVNNALYRRQGLRWVVGAAESLSLRLVLHGRGWEENPEFAPFAGGMIEYTRDLPEATSKARFCMVLEPYFPTQHQRALDTWMWGGLPLIRRRERDVQQSKFNRMLDRLGPDVQSYEDAMAAAGDESDCFEQVYRSQIGLHAWDGRGDLISLHRQRERNGIGYLNAHPPRYDETAFSNEKELTRIMGTLIDDPGRYDELRQIQHDWIRPRFSYELGAQRLLEQVAANMPGLETSGCR